jgi:hypothetical protein
MIQSGLQFKEGKDIFVITNVNRNSVIYTYIDDNGNLTSERETLAYTKQMFDAGYWIEIKKKVKFKIEK